MRRLPGVLLLAASQLCLAQDQTPTIALKAVKINPTCIGGANAGSPCVQGCECNSFRCGGDIEPTDSVALNPGGIVVVEVFGSEWSPNAERL